MAIEEVSSESVAAVASMAPLAQREPQADQPGVKESEKTRDSAITPSIRPSDDAMRTLFAERNEDPAVGAAVVAQRYQVVQDAKKTQTVDQPADQQKAPAVTAAQAAGNAATAQIVRPPENPQLNQPAPPTPGQSVSAALRVK